MKMMHTLVGVAIVAGTLLPTGPALADLRVWTTAQDRARAAQPRLAATWR